ncbi:hypothetical protein E2562_019325 [Oryza meyeriana var. granulata]|uniref:Uncharacterized protein n=1 Tax=Oryza meyeriana var. granulata TaxID=110450 RepID=A0A6G1C623_9ORYZ|nr:hypothetical protein E2562_019325 [Oryza meyeriana var. granulata]
MPTRPERHESTAVSEPPSGLSVFGSLDYSRKGFSFEKLNDTELLTMRHYILTNCDECATLPDEHKDLLKKYNPHNVERRHREQFVRWFEDKEVMMFQCDWYDVPAPTKNRASGEEEAEVDVDSLVVGVEHMTVTRDQGELMNWRRTDMDGETIEPSVIENAIAKSVPEPMDEDYSDDDGDDVDTYIGDGVVAPAVATDNEADDDLFV